MANVNAGVELFTGTKSVRLEDLPEEAWRVIVGDEGKAKGVNKLYAVVPWLYRCVDIRASAVQNMPWEILRGETVVMTNEDDAPDQYPWLDNLPDLLYRTEAALALTGRAYWFKERNFMRTLGVRYMLPGSVEPVIDEDGLRGFERKLARRTIPLEVDDLVFFWMPDPEVEIGPAKSYPGKSAMAAAGVLASMDAFLTSYFERGMVKATLLTYDSQFTISDDERDRVKEWWRRMFSGIKNAFTTEVLRGEVKPVIIGEGLKDLQNTALSAEEKENICTAFGVPQSKVTANASNYATKHGDDLSFIQDKIAPECKWLAGVINRQLLKPMGLQLHFKPDELSIMQEDETQRAQSLKMLVDAGMSLEMATTILGYDLPDDVELRTVSVAAEAVADSNMTDDSAPADGVVTEKQVLNGAQIQSALSIIDTYSQGKLPRDNAVFMVQTFFNITPDIAEKLVPLEGEIDPAAATPPQLRPFTGQEPPPPTEEEERDEEEKRFRRWAKKRANPDPDQFESVVLSRADKVALLEAAVTDDAPFRGEGWQDYP